MFSSRVNSFPLKWTSFTLTSSLFQMFFLSLGLWMKHICLLISAMRGPESPCGRIHAAQKATNLTGNRSDSTLSCRCTVGGPPSVFLCLSFGPAWKSKPPTRKKNPKVWHHLQRKTSEDELKASPPITVLILLSNLRAENHTQTHWCTHTHKRTCIGATTKLKLKYFFKW